MAFYQINNFIINHVYQQKKAQFQNELLCAERISLLSVFDKSSCNVNFIIKSVSIKTKFSKIYMEIKHFREAKLF